MTDKVRFPALNSPPHDQAEGVALLKQVDAAIEKAKARVSTPSIGHDQRSGSDGVFDESAERIRATVGDDGETNTSCVATVFSIIEIGSRLAVTHLYGARDEALVMDAPAFAPGPSTDPGFIHFDMFLRPAANLVVLGAHHSGAELMKDAEGRLVARQAKLPLKLDSRHSGRLAGDQVSRPEPGRQRCVTSLHDGPGHKADVFAASAAAQNAGARLKAEWLTDHAAPRAGEPTSPAGLFKIRSARRVVGENTLKFRQGPRKRQI